MVKVNEVIGAVRLAVSNNVRLSLPFIVNDDGEGKLCFFGYLTDDKSDQSVATRIVSVYLVDAASLKIDEYSVKKQPTNLPIKISPQAVSDTDAALNGYCAYLDEFLGTGKIDGSACAKAFAQLVSDEFKQVYILIGAEFID